jgi:hypothetical protein
MGIGAGAIQLSRDAAEAIAYFSFRQGKPGVCSHIQEE